MKPNNEFCLLYYEGYQTKNTRKSKPESHVLAVLIIVEGLSTIYYIEESRFNNDNNMFICISFYSLRVFCNHQRASEQLYSIWYLTMFFPNHHRPSSSKNFINVLTDTNYYHNEGRELLKFHEIMILTYDYIFLRLFF